MEKQVKEKSVKQPKEKKPLSKKAKIWISLGTAFVFVASAIAVVLALVLSPRALNLHGLRVANFDNYAGIGAASFDNGKKTTGNQRDLYFIITYTIFTLQSNTYSNQRTVHPCVHRIFR